MNKTPSRFWILVGTMIVQLGLGTIYAWSLLNGPLAREHGWAVQQVVLSFSITSLSLALGTLFAAKLQELLGIRKMVSLCALVMGMALIAASHVDSLWMLYLTAGFLVGFANGIAYISTLSNCIKWFPTRKGVIGGVALSCYGMGGLLFKFVHMYTLNNYGVHFALIVWGICVFALIFIGAQLIKAAPAITEKIEAGIVKLKDFTRKELLQIPQAYLLFVALFTSCMGGLYVIGAAKNIGVDIAHLNAEVAAQAVGIIAIFNTLGRILLGSASDKLGYTRVSAFAFAVMVICSGILIFGDLSYGLFLFAVGGIAFAYGGNLSIFPAIVGNFFGLKNHSKNYGIIYQGFGFGGLAGGMVANLMGGLKPTFFLIFALAIISLMIMLFIRAPKVNRI